MDGVEIQSLENFFDASRPVLSACCRRQVNICCKGTGVHLFRRRANELGEGGRQSRDNSLQIFLLLFFFSLPLALPLSSCVSASLMPIHLLDKWYCHDDREFLQRMIIELYASHKIDKQAEGNEREGERERKNEKDRQRKIAFPHRKRINRSPIMS